jgi:2-amino-4-hydroxy-6-hydroxymethyldihydropteridine diphosphokinase
MHKVYLSTGSSSGKRLDWLIQAAWLVQNQIGSITAFSPVYESEPWGFEADQNFFNQVLCVETLLDPEILMESILSLEAAMGRKREGSGYASRNIDLDILFYDERIVRQENLIIPHPLLHKRGFVLEPLTLLSPERIHPVLYCSIAALSKELASPPMKMVCDASEFSRKLEEYSKTVSGI